jgi:hypothetical protein
LVAAQASFDITGEVFRLRMQLSVGASLILSLSNSDSLGCAEPAASTMCSGPLSARTANDCERSDENYSTSEHFAWQRFGSWRV